MRSRCRTGVGQWRWLMLGQGQTNDLQYVVRCSSVHLKVVCAPWLRNTTSYRQTPECSNENIYLNDTYQPPRALIRTTLDRMLWGYSWLAPCVSLVAILVFAGFRRVHSGYSWLAPCVPLVAILVFAGFRRVHSRRCQCRCLSGKSPLLHSALTSGH